MTNEDFSREYERLAHAVQSAIAFDYNKSLDAPDTVVRELKHIRTGLNCLMSDLGALGKLLVSKGVFSEQEYFHAILTNLAQEVERTAIITKQKYNLPPYVSFG